MSGREGREDFFQQTGEFEMEGARGGIEEGKKEGREEEPSCHVTLFENWSNNIAC